MNHSLPINYPDRPSKYSFAQPSFSFIQNKLTLDSAVAGSEPTTTKPESFPSVIPPQIATPKIKLTSPISDQSFVPSPISPAIKRASFNPIVPPLYPTPPSFARYPSTGYPPFPYPYTYPFPTINTNPHYTAFLTFLRQALQIA
ncbi:hypothetical protein BOTCAL_0922g00010 [Botryotinia calthae]|uniref:Uncharacterized protein n=1 Tax=Botryotinia calthae TaxID=38488 RepID=A0A4Y8CEU4_9HELO|nr:hypothetical protein BOTCAL_0922g00010 [Botryotinia calthae]